MLFVYAILNKNHFVSSSAIADCSQIEASSTSSSHDQDYVYDIANGHQAATGNVGDTCISPQITPKQKQLSR